MIMKIISGDDRDIDDDDKNGDEEKEEEEKYEEEEVGIWKEEDG